VTNRLLIALLLAGITAALPLNAEPQANKGSISGNVVRWGTRDPVSDVDVELIRTEGTASYPLGPLVVPPGLYSPGIPIRPIYPNPIDISYARASGDGKFRFTDLLPGKYKLWAARTGFSYFVAEYGQRDPRGPGQNFQLAEGQVITDLNLPIAPNGAISGVVFDADGAPAAHVRVQAFEATWNSGRRLFQVTEGTETDDRGFYRLFFLPPGKYTIAARPEDPRRCYAMLTSPLSASIADSIESFAEAPIFFRRGDGGSVIEETYTTAYFGGTTDPQLARLIDLAPGGNVEGIDLSLRSSRIRAVHVRGMVTDSTTGKAASGAIVRAVPVVWSPSLVSPASTADADGHFDISGVGTGSYTLVATLRANNNTQTFATGIEVQEKDIDGMDIVVKPGASITGHISVEDIPGGGPPPDISSMSISLLSNHPNLSGSVSRSIQNGTFTLTGVQSGTYRVFVGPVFDSPGFPPYPATPRPAAAMQGMYVKSIRVGAEDALNGYVNIDTSQSPDIAIVLGTNGGSIDGTVVDSRQQIEPNAVVVLIPESPSLRNRMDLYKSAVSGENGQFSIQGIAPGNYKLFSWEYAGTGAWFDADFIRPVESRGKALSITAGRNPSTQLSVIGASQ
jgi:hypothetical protein